MFLTDVEEGGETWFPEGAPVTVSGEGSAGAVDAAPCLGGGETKTGLSVKPRKGWAIYFHSYHPNGTADHSALHSGCKVIRGEKRTATKWIRMNRYNHTDQDEAYAENTRRIRREEAERRLRARAGETKSR